MSRQCLAEDELRAFAVGDLPESEMDRCAQHILSCPKCESTLETLDDYIDGFLRELRQVSPSISQPEVASDIVFDPGRRFARKLTEGPCRLGRFELEEVLGDGSFGFVFRARDLDLERVVAVKVQRAPHVGKEEISGFLREARSAAQLQHPGIVALYDCGQTEDGVCFLVTELIQGETLEAAIEHRRFAITESVKLIATLAETLQYAHERGVIHRDIKPSNVILDASNQPHITDFGLAKRMFADQTMTSDGHVLGTPAYMSPEQARGDSHLVDARSDVHSLGVILYELLTGERPFQGNRRLLLLQVLEDEPRSPRRLNDHIPRDLETICLKALAKNPARRYGSARDLAEDLHRFSRGEPILARPVGPAGRLWRWCRRYPLAVGLFLAVVIGSGVGFWYLSTLSRYFVQETALDSARMDAEMLELINAYYSEEVVDRLALKGMKLRVTHEYALRKDSIPIPATFTIDAGRRISRGSSGMRVALYSSHPWRETTESKDAFQLEALTVLQERVKQGDSNLSFHQITEIEGRPVLRYAKAQIMQESCVKCHNASRQSPKRDWKEGDLAGVLEIARPLDRDIERTASGLHGAFILVGSVGALLFALGCGLFFAGRIRRASQALP